MRSIVPFAPTKSFNRNDGGNRKWVSYIVSNIKLHSVVFVSVMVMEPVHFPKGLSIGNMFILV